MAEPILDYVMTPHAATEMVRRGIAERTVRHVLATAEQRFAARTGRDVVQSRVRFGDKEYLVRIFVDVDRMPVEVVTVYRTSNIAKYWRPET